MKARRLVATCLVTCLSTACGAGAITPTAPPTVAAPSAGASPPVPATPPSTATAPASSTGPASSSSRASAASAASDSRAVPWASAALARPAWLEYNAAGIAADPSNGKLLAYCVAGGVRVSRDGGATWASVPVGGVPEALKATGYALTTPSAADAPLCAAAVPDPGHPGTVYADFVVGSAKYGAPPLYHVAVQTRDNGAHWTPVRAPGGFDTGGFGGFRVSGNSVQALFGLKSGQQAQRGLAVLQTADGGQAWQPATLACPSHGPCVRWGPSPTSTGSCSMHQYPQPVEASADGGHTWTALQLSDPFAANACDPAQLIGWGDGRIAVLTSGADQTRTPLELSADGGKTWRDVAVPPVPGSDPPFGAVQMLPDGTLLGAASGPSASGVYVLTPGAVNWCPVHGLTVDPRTARVAGDTLWWVDTTAHSTPLSSIHC